MNPARFWIIVFNRKAILFHQTNGKLNTYNTYDLGNLITKKNSNGEINFIRDGSHFGACFVIICYL